MEAQPVCLHDDRGYYVGYLSMGLPVRLSREHFPSKTACLLAIAAKLWTRRSLAVFD